jgi:hypothetical protein
MTYKTPSTPRQSRESAPPRPDHWPDMFAAAFPHVDRDILSLGRLLSDDQAATVADVAHAYWYGYHRTAGFIDPPTVAEAIALAIVEVFELAHANIASRSTH